MGNQRQIGREYEKMAAEYLKACGFQILSCNYRCRYGEIDLIAKDGEMLVFCEVKYRSDTRKGEPAEAVGIKKQQTIYKCAAAYLQEYGIGEMPCRFDVISILGREICLIRDAF